MTTLYHPRRNLEGLLTAHSTPVTSSTFYSITKKQCDLNNKPSLHETESRTGNKKECNESRKGKGTNQLLFEISVSASSDISITHSPMLFNPSPTQKDFEQICAYCKSMSYLFHEKRYSSYCYQAAYSYLQDKDHDSFAGFSPAQMESGFVVRRSDMWMRFGYYTGGNCTYLRYLVLDERYRYFNF